MRSRLRRSRISIGVLACVALTSVGLAPTSAAATTPSSSVATTSRADGHFAPYPGDGSVSPMTESGVITVGSCKYRQAIDDPHASGGDTSIHGGWLRYSGTCPSKANVDISLQAYWCDPFGCGWITVASGSGDYYAGGGRGRRATARRGCSSTASSVGWRGFVDVDLNGVVDPSGYTYSVIKNLYCSP
jgi:hypothetical protein